MTAPYYHDGYAGNMSDYHDNHDFNSNNYHHPDQIRGNIYSRIPRPPLSNQAPMRSAKSASSSARSDTRRDQKHHHHPQNSGLETSQSLYNDIGYKEDYDPGGHNDQWPLPGHSYEQSDRVKNPHRTTPHRPRRPDDPPQQRSDLHQPVRDQLPSDRHVVNSARQYQHLRGPQLLSHHSSGQWTGDGYGYNPANRPPPLNPQSRQTFSPIPQYPESQLPEQAAYARPNTQRAPPGPPPLGRRGPATYFPDVGSVHPIVEETESVRSSIRNDSARTGGHESKTSFASSNAIPIGIPQIYLADQTGSQPRTIDHAPSAEHVYEISDTDDDDIDQTLARFERVVPPSRDRDSPEVMFRQASVGKKSRPTLTNVKSGLHSRVSSASDRGTAASTNQPKHTNLKDIQVTTAETEHSRAIPHDTLEGQAGPGAHDEQQSRGRGSSPTVSEAAAVLASVARSGTCTPEEVSKPGTGLLDASDSSGSKGEEQRRRSKELLGAAIASGLYPQRSKARSPLAPSDDNQVQSILDSLRKGGAINADEADGLTTPASGLSEKAGKRRPPRIDVDAVRDAEARGSLTSLPDLIMRATKLASNLDRGKTASRLGMNWFDGAEEKDRRRSGSIGDALNSFPLAYNATPPGSRGELRKSMMSGRHRHSTLASDSDSGVNPDRKRRCCGMPVWLFILLILVVLLLIAAAVVLPVVFVVLPKQSNNSNNDPSPVGSCETTSTCENGGANILSSDGYCECICRNGYHGKTCSSHAVQGCTTASIGTTENATLGEAIPRLLEGSQSNFNIPLDGSELLSLFSNANVSCVSQNALVTFNNVASKRSEAVAVAVIPETLLVLRQATASTVTRDGIVYATGSPTPSFSAPTATSSVSRAGGASTSRGSESRTTVDFARVAVLYVLQASGDMSLAASAQEKLQSYFRAEQTSSFGNDTASGNIDLGGAFSCNLTANTINVGNGTIVGGNSS